MKPNTKSIFFKLSIVCFVAFIIQLIFMQGYARGVVEGGDTSASLIQPIYWLGVFWVSLGSLCWFKSTKNKQTLLNQVLVFVLSPIALSPVIIGLYIAVVLLPLYSLVGENLN